MLPAYPAGDAAPGPSAFQSFRQRIAGSSKRQVAARLGPPRAAVLGDARPTAGPQPATHQPDSFWQANTWYYPFDPESRSAVAIQFINNRVTRVEFIGELK